MNLEGIRRPGRLVKVALTQPCCFASLMLVALLFLPTRSFAACTTANPNHNPNPAAFAATGDFNGDCKSDILWRNGSTGQVYEWLMNGTAIMSSGSPYTPTSDWVIQGVGDFDGDGMSDILWQNTASGEVFIWLMNGTTIKSSGSPYTLTSDWVIQGVGDFDGDGKSDILWRNTTTGQVYIWLMNGTAIKSSGSPFTLADPTWVIQGVGDFDGDGQADILWRNTATGQIYVWLMNGTTIRSKGSPYTLNDATWVIEGVGDFDGDGNSDILWQNSTTGQVFIWLMNGTAIKSSASPYTLSPPSSTACCDGVGNGWSIQGVGDYDGSGRAGILWEQLGSGEVYIWLMNGETINSSGSPNTVAPVWEIATLAPYGCSSQVLCNLLSATNNARANGPFGSGNPAPSATTGGPLNPMVWDPEAASVAQNWAAQCQGLTHNTNRDGGENIYIAGSTTTPVTITGTDAVSDWMGESSGYTYSPPACNPIAPNDSCGHYTQEVWRTTTAMGCAVQQCTTNSPFGDSFPDYALVVCDYTPAGNWNQPSQQPY